MITGTFLDEISHDVASANWGREEWRRDFASMKADGIDTIVLNRVGYRDRSTFDSRVLRKAHPQLVVQEDLVALYLGLAAEHGISLWFGTYDSGEFARAGKHRKEVDLNRALVDEVWERYGRSSAFRGWYLSQDVDAIDDDALRVYEELIDHVRGTSGLPVLVSRSIGGPTPYDENAPIDRRLEDWDHSFARLRGLVDVVALRDGDVPTAALGACSTANVELARRHAIQCWSNVETFDRDVHVKYPPIAWPKLRHKMQCALAAGAQKLITFEYSHFLSPNSMYSSAHALHRRYREWLATQR